MIRSRGKSLGLGNRNPAIAFLIIAFLFRWADASPVDSSNTHGDASIINEQSKGAKARVMDDGSVSCPLDAGETTFVVTLPKKSPLDRFTFINENATARGELKIFVSNQLLPASDPNWTVVDGAIAFKHKRLFNLSLVGVEAKYVKLSFRVEKQIRFATIGF